ncbi:MAG: protein kinase, partial [Candidatus Aminicenantes bacterium]|nr:protein kinase [Candidatus Aminicenantes bacterium]
QNIVTIYEINEFEDQTYIAMEYVEGETLKDIICKGEVTSPLQLNQIINITTQICEGLKCAHESGIVHRDIKPQNIIINKGGQVKILDFGLAKLKGVTQLTKESSTLGTVHYISPEQAKGIEVDHKTDIWSLGVVMYEMVTGQLPFKGDYDQAVIYSILNEEPEPLSGVIPEVPGEVGNSLSRMLNKNPDQRPQNVSEIIINLKEILNKLKSQNNKQKSEITSTNKNKKFLFAGISVLIIFAFTFIYMFFFSKPVNVENKSIAVLPFKNMSENQQNEYFCDGITEDIITQLSKITGLKVISRTSVFYFKNKEKKIKDIANELGVTTILEGSVRQSKEKVRITAQLIDAKTDNHIWAETYDRAMKDIFDIQSDVANQIAKTLRVKLLPATTIRINQKPTENIEAYKLYLQGRFHWNKRSAGDLEKAIFYFNKAVELDPEYALGYSGLADTYTVIGELYPDLVKSAYAKAEKNCLKALSIDENLAQAYSALGEIESDWKWEFDSAEKNYLKAIRINPNYATAHQWLAEYYNVRGKFKLAHEELDIAEELDPLSFIIQMVRANIYLAEQKYSEAIKLANNVFLINPKIELNNIILINAYMGIKSYDKVLELASQLEIPQLSEFIKFRILISRGHLSEARKIFQGLNIESLEVASIYPSVIAIIYADLGNMDKAVKWYERAIEKKDRIVLLRYGISRSDPLLNDPRIQEMLREAGLED